MSLLHRLPFSFNARPTAPRRRPDPDAAEAPASDDRPRGCGWFDSSHELRAGLRVTEHAQADGVVNEIPLSWWLSWELDAVRTSVR